MENNFDEPFYYNERVDVIRQKYETVEEGIISSIRGNLLFVKFHDSSEDEMIYRDDNLILKQCKIKIFYFYIGVPGRPIRKFNRIDVKYSLNNRWYEAFVIAIEPDKILYRLKKRIEGQVITEWLNKDSNEIAPVGIYSGRFNPSLHSSEEINEYLYKKKKFFKASQIQERKFREEIKTINMKIKDICGDGNCLYRAVCDQVYGTEDYFQEVKSKCLEYIEIEKNFFSQYIEGGLDEFDNYIALKKTDGVWGDDIEIQALSEIYNRPIEIYSHSKEPLKTFHETAGSHSRITDRELNSNLYPIKLSYHGRQHYNSLIPIENYDKFKSNIVTTPPGDYEKLINEKLRLKNQRENIDREKGAAHTSSGNNLNQINHVNQHNQHYHQSIPNYVPTVDQISIDVPAKVIYDNLEGDKAKLEYSRGNFIEKRMKDLDIILEERFTNDSSNCSENLSQPNSNFSEIIKQSENFATEQDLLNSVLEMSKNEIPKTYEYNNSNISGQDLTTHPSILFIIEMGFTTEEAILAYSAVGEDPDIMLQYLYSLSLN